MRQILFKAKRLDNGEWVEGSYVNKTDYYGIECDEHYIIDGTVTDMEGYGEHYLVDKDTICQYTGLTDKNGNKIWENDVVQYDFGEYMIGIQKAIIQYSIKYHGYKINPINDWSYTNIEDCEVIGNIFDNKEMLGE